MSRWVNVSVETVETCIEFSIGKPDVFGVFSVGMRCSAGCKLTLRWSIRCSRSFVPVNVRGGFQPEGLSVREGLRDDGLLWVRHGE